MSRFFIDRPIFAWVISIVIMLAGILSIETLPVSQYPNIALPQVRINAVYPGASAETLDNTVTQLIEQKMSGIDNLIYFASTSDSSGQVTISLTFAAGTDSDIAQVQVQNKLQLVTPQLPEEVQRQGIAVTKATSSYLMVVGLYSKDGSISSLDLADYVSSNLQDPISRLDGVGEVTLFGSDKAMRIWLDPAKLNNYKLTVTDIAAAVQAQNAQVSAGQLGGTPSVSDQQLNATITAQSRLQTPEEFRNILLKVNTDGSKVLLKDVATVDFGQESYDSIGEFNGLPATGLAINLATNANALDTAANVKNALEEFKAFFPPGMEVVYPYDTTPFVQISIHEVYKTLGEAILLVFVVMYLFLQSFRATIIPTIAVPVVLLGTFAVLAIAGFSINTLTMFAMVLAIGLLVDDAIVVVENVERVMHEDKLTPKEAAKKSMDQITGALVGIALVLSAVFIPMAFFGGSTGVIYRQFSITIVSAMTLSVIVALILTPALCATILKPMDHDESKKNQTGFFAWFNHKFNVGVQTYESRVAKILAKSRRYLLIYGVIVVVMIMFFSVIPKGFLPEEDQGILMTQIQLPAGATQERTQKVIDQVREYYLTHEKKSVESVFTVAGFSFSGRGQNTGLAFIKLKDWNERKAKELKAPAIAGRAQMAFLQLKDATVYAIVPPAVIEMGNANGFDLQLQDRAGLGHEALMQARNQFMGIAYSPNYQHILKNVRPQGQDDNPQYKIEVDQEKANALGLSLTTINSTLQSGWGSTYINDFIDKGRVKKVYMQSIAEGRMVPEDLDKWFVRNNIGEMVPFSAFAIGKWEYGSPRLERYNGLPAMEIVGEPAENQSTGAAMAAVEEIAKQLPPGIGYEWTGISLQERQSGDQAPFLYTVSMLVVFLCLAALYESWSIPFSVMLVVPLGVIGAQLAAWLFSQANDVYFQVGFLTIIGLSAKNAILIVEFAKSLREQGYELIAATLEACRLRIRPIIMTSMAFILGVLPLALSSGAGSGSQNAIGIGVVGGMLSATILGIFFIPLFFVLVVNLTSRRKKTEKPEFNKENEHATK